MRVLVTGCCGFVGSHLTEALLERGHKVIGIDPLIRGKRENISNIIENPKFHFFEEDIRSVAGMNGLCKNVDYVFHQAAVCINYCNKYPIRGADININGTLNVLEACANNKVKKVIAASSASVYGNPVQLPITEDHPFKPKNIYGVTKIADEELLKYYARERNLPFIGFRYMNIYGPKSSPDAFYTTVITVWIKRILEGKAPVIYGDGKQSMDFVHVKDIVQANLLAMDKDVENEFFNVGTGTETTLNTLCDTILCLMNSNLKPLRGEARNVDVKRRISDISKINRMLGYKPTIELEKGLKTVIDEFAPDKLA